MMSLGSFLDISIWWSTPVEPPKRKKRRLWRSAEISWLVLNCGFVFYKMSVRVLQQRGDWSRNAVNIQSLEKAEWYWFCCMCERETPARVSFVFNCASSKSSQGVWRKRTVPHHHRAFTRLNRGVRFLSVELSFTLHYTHLQLYFCLIWPQNLVTFKQNPVLVKAD